MSMTTEEITQRVAAVNADKDRQTLEWHLRKMDDAVKSMSTHLREIRDEKLWRHDYASFEEFCEKRLHRSLRRANQMIAAEGVQSLLMIEAQSDPETRKAVSELNERQVTELAKIPKEKRIEVLREVIKTVGPKKVTAKAIHRTHAKAKVVEGVIVEEKLMKCCPTCGGKGKVEA